MTLQEAARAGDVAELARLLDAGASIDAADHNGFTPLLHAIYGKHLAAAELLVARGASYVYKSLGGVDARRAAADLMPALVPALAAKGATPWEPVQVAWIALDGLGPYARALITAIRTANPLDPEPTVMRYVDPAMPAELRALLQAWAHVPASAWIDLGKFEIQRRSLGRGADLAELFVDAAPEEQLDWAHTIVVGTVYGGPELLVKWAPGQATASWVIADVEYQTTRTIGDFEDLIESAKEWAEERDEEPKGLARLIELAGG